MSQASYITGVSWQGPETRQGGLSVIFISPVPSRPYKTLIQTFAETRDLAGLGMAQGSVQSSGRSPLNEIRGIFDSERTETPAFC